MNLVNDIEIEKIVLITLIVFENEYEKFGHLISDNLFTIIEHKQIYEAIITAETIDFNLIHRDLKNHQNHSAANYLIQNITSVSTSAKTEYYIHILIELAIKRDFILKFTSLLSLAKNLETDIFELQDKCLNTFDNLFINNFLKTNKSVNSLKEILPKIEDKFKSITEDKVPGINCSLEIINKTFGGWQPSEYYLLAGRPGMGKTTFLIQALIDSAEHIGAAGVFSLEMSTDAIGTKVVSNLTQIPNASFLRKGLNENEVYQYYHSKDDLEKYGIYIDDTSGITINELRAKARLMQQRFGVKIIFIDYLQLITSKSNKSNREQEVSEISRGLKSIAKELNIPVIALSQLSREVEKRNEKRPQLSDLRDSGSLEQDADGVIFLYRPEYYGIQEWGADYNNEPTKNECEVIIAKNRNGGINWDRVKVNLPISKFSNILNQVFID